MFANAKKLSATTPAAKSKTPAKPVETIEGLAEVAALDACAKAIKGLLDLKKNELKNAAVERLVARGVQQQHKPDSLSLSEGPHATGRVAITKRSTASPLSGDELELLAELVGEAERDEDGAITAVPNFAETVEQVPAMLAVNPAYASNEALLKKIDKALSGIKGIPEDFIVQTPAKAKVVVSETATNDVFRLAPESVEQVFGLVANTSLTPAFKDIGAAWELVKPMLIPDTAALKASLKAALKASLKAG
jgi:hypothetical protein